MWLRASGLMLAAEGLREINPQPWGPQRAIGQEPKIQQEGRKELKSAAAEQGNFGESRQRSRG